MNKSTVISSSLDGKKKHVNKLVDGPGRLSSLTILNVISYDKMKLSKTTIQMRKVFFNKK